MIGVYSEVTLILFSSGKSHWIIWVLLDATGSTEEDIHYSISISPSCGFTGDSNLKLFTLKGKAVTSPANHFTSLKTGKPHSLLEFYVSLCVIYVLYVVICVCCIMLAYGSMFMHTHVGIFFHTSLSSCLKKASLGEVHHGVSLLVREL